MDFSTEPYTFWLNNWLNEHSENEYYENERKDETFLVDFSNYSNLSEVSLEIYNCIRSSDLSLDQLSSYINKLGVIISQSDLRAISSQPRSRMAQMFSVIYESGDISTILLECINKNSYAYVYLMIRLLFEIVLYTKSTPVRSFAYAQILKNKQIINALMALSYNPSGVPLKCFKDSELSSNNFVKYASSTDNHHIPIDPDLSSEGYIIDKHKNPIGEIGFPNSSYSQNVFESLLLDMLQSPDLNVSCMAIQLVAILPSVASKSPQILNELYIAVIGDDDEQAYLASISLTTILPLIPELVALNFIKACYSNVLNRFHNIHRIKGFTLIALACKGFRGLSKFSYRMLWSLYLEMEKYTKLEDRAYAIFTESKVTLLLASTLIAVEQASNLKRQEERLRTMLYNYLALFNMTTKPDSTNFETNRTNLLLIRGLIYSLFTLYFSQEPDKDITDKLTELTNIMENNTFNKNKYVNLNNMTDGIDPLLDKKDDFFSFIYYGTCIKLLELFVKDNLLPLFNHFVDFFQHSLQFRPENINILFTFKRCLKHFPNSSAIVLKLVETIQSHIDQFDMEFRAKVLLVLLEMIEFSFFMDLENFTNFVARYNEKVKSRSLKLIMRPLLQIQNINYASMLTDQEILVHHVYSCVSNELLSDTYYARPLVVDFANGAAYAGESSLTVTLVSRKSSWGSEYSKVIRRQIYSNFILNDQKIEECDLYSNLYKVGTLCLRLGFYSEASAIFERLSFVTESHYYWIRLLFKYAHSQIIEPNELKNKSDPSVYFKSYVCRMSNLLALFKVYRTTSSLKAHSHAQKCWDCGLNYHPPVPVLYSFATMVLCLKLAAADLLTSIKDKNYALQRFVKLFTSLKAAFKALEFIFRYMSKETVCVLSGYQAIVTVVLHVVKSLESKHNKSKKNSSASNEKVDLYCFWTYLSDFDPNIDKPDVLYVMDMFPKTRRGCLLTNIFMTQKNGTKPKPLNDQNVVSNSKIKVLMKNAVFDTKYVPESTDISLDTIWVELIGSARLLGKDSKVLCYQRDMPSFNAIYKILQPLSKDYSDSKFIAFLESVIFTEIQTPIGILKQFPLPYASLTATLFMQKRGDVEIQTINIQGQLENYKNKKEITRVCLRMEFSELQTDNVFYYTLKMIKGTVHETILINVPQEICKNGSFVAVPVDKNYIPRGVPCTVLLTHKIV